MKDVLHRTFHCEMIEGQVLPDIGQNSACAYLFVWCNFTTFLADVNISLFLLIVIFHLEAIIVRNFTCESNHVLPRWKT